MVHTSDAYVVRTNGGPIQIENVSYDNIGDQEILVENVAFSVCASDIKAAQGKFYLKPPMILGHESAGKVKEVGRSVRTVKPGDRVILSYSHCKACPRCLHGHAPYCDEIRNLNFSGLRSDGSYAATDSDGNPIKSFFFGQSSMGRFSLAHENCAVKVDATDEELSKFAALGCGIQTGAGAILNVCKPPPSSTIAIFGAGSVALSAALAARLSSPSLVVLVDISQAKLDMIPAEFGFKTLNSASMSEERMGEEMMKLTKGQGFNHVLDCAGSGQVVSQAHSLLAQMGTVVSVGGSEMAANIIPSKHLVRGATYRGSHQGDSVPETFIPFLIDLWRRGSFPFDKLLSLYSFDDLDNAITDVKEGRAIKPVLLIG